MFSLKGCFVRIFMVLFWGVRNIGGVLKGLENVKVSFEKSSDVSRSC